MYVSAVIYPMALIKEKIPEYAWIIQYNPLAYIVESSRYMLLGVGDLPLGGMLYTLIFTFAIFILGVLLFNKTEKSFIDTV